MTKHPKITGLKQYEGHIDKRDRQTVVVTDGAGKNPKLLDPRYDLVNHSPDGFSWGYHGSGPAQLALAICADLVGDNTAIEIYQDFKVRVVANLHGEFILMADDAFDIINRILGGDHWA